MSNLDKDIEILKEFENYSPYEEIGETGKQAIKNVLTELEIYKKIAYKLAEKIEILDKDVDVCDNIPLAECSLECVECIIDIARKEVEKGE